MSTSATSDIQGMLDRLQQGDPTARQELLDRAHDRLVRIASALGGISAVSAVATIWRASSMSHGSA